MPERRRSAASRWETLQAKAHLPEFQAIIRDEISLGSIRVSHAAGGGLQILPMDACHAETESVIGPNAARFRR